MLADTQVNGNFAHIGTLGNVLGRKNGMNEKGLAVCQSSNGMPAGNFEGGLQAAVSGLTFWCVVRSLLENCATIEQTLVRMKEMPIGYNLNLILADAAGTIALFEIINGSKALKKVTASDRKPYLRATNHTVLPELVPQEKICLENSVNRLNRSIVPFLTLKKVQGTNQRIDCEAVSRWAVLPLCSSLFRIAPCGYF
jgi:hypothetical protein